MTPEMSEMAQYRMIVSAGGRSEDDEGGAWEGVKLACQDPFTWIYTVLHFGLIVALSFKDFFPSVSPNNSLHKDIAVINVSIQIVKTLGYSNLMTYLIQAPPYIFAYLATCAISWSSGRYMEHCWHIVGSTVACIIGVVIMISTLNPGARYFGMFLLCAGPFVGLNVRTKSFVLGYSTMLTGVDPHSLGNYQRGPPSHKAWRSGCYYQLHRVSLALVHTIFLRKSPIYNTVDPR